MKAFLKRGGSGSARSETLEVIGLGRHLKNTSNRQRRTTEQQEAKASQQGNSPPSSPPVLCYHPTLATAYAAFALRLLRLLLLILPMPVHLYLSPHQFIIIIIFFLIIFFSNTNWPINPSTTTPLLQSLQ